MDPLAFGSPRGRDCPVVAGSLFLPGESFSSARPMPHALMILIQQRYVSTDPARQAELESARASNERCHLLTRTVAVEGAAKRWTFADLFELAARDFPGQICAIANSDISFDASLAAVEPLLSRPSVLVALTRWDDDTAPSMEGRVDPVTWRFYSQSQDAWIFRAGALPSFHADFQLGVPRCENRLAFEAARAGIVIRNPALSIKARHHHATNLRTWKRTDHYRGPLLFPRLTTSVEDGPEGLVLVHGFRKREAVVRLGDGAVVEAASTTRLGFRDLFRARLGLRSPFYIRRRLDRTG
jgi:hypothetical protein